jgi:glycine/D-amino acid oxidase-like deaminating enzyme
MVDAPAVLTVLRRALASAQTASIEQTALKRITVDEAGAVGNGVNGAEFEADAIVLAAGTWSAAVEGLPRPVPIRPVRGTMVAVDARLVRVPVYEAGTHSYVVPRGTQTLIGATSDDVGFDARPGARDAETLVESAVRYLPAIRDLARIQPRSGLRPMTPDGLAMIGRDPEVPALYYATGHGRNGILQAALTAEAITSLILNETPVADLSAFNPARFTDV